MIDCARVQAALSARLDGEDTGVPDDVVDAHLSGCVECQAFFEQAARLNRQLRLTEVPVGDAVPDLSEMILAGVEPVRRRRAASRVLGLALSRVMLILVGLGLVVWAYRLVALSTVGPGVELSTPRPSAWRLPAGCFSRPGAPRFLRRSCLSTALLRRLAVVLPPVTWCWVR